MLPVLTSIADVLGIVGGLGIAVLEIHMTAQDYITSIWQQLQISDICSGLGKTFFFGLEIAAIGCYNGLHVEGGADIGGPGDHPHGRVRVHLHPGVGLLPDQALPGDSDEQPSSTLPTLRPRRRPGANRSSTFDNVWKRYGGKDILAGANLHITRGEVVCILGPSGTGKSVTLRHINGLTQPDDGDVRVFGESIVSLLRRGADSRCAGASPCSSRAARSSTR